MITKISTDNYIVVESNVVYLQERNSTLTLHFSFSNDFEFDFIIYFSPDNRDKGSRILRLESKEDEKVLKIACFNFNNPLGTGTIEPLKLATVKGKDLYIHFWSYLLGGGVRQTRKVEYTVLSKE